MVPRESTSVRTPRRSLSQAPADSYVRPTLELILTR
jgi:hypothetical protein